jgi:hypothetical protein
MTRAPLIAMRFYGGVEVIAVRFQWWRTAKGGDCRAF